MVIFKPTLPDFAHSFTEDLIAFCIDHAIEYPEVLDLMDDDERATYRTQIIATITQEITHGNWPRDSFICNQNPDKQ